MAGLIKGLGLIIDDTDKKTPYTQAIITGLSLLVATKSIEVKIVRWNGAAYVPVQNAEVKLKLSLQTVSIFTNALGIAVTDFDEANIEVFLNNASLPAGYSNYEVHKLKTSPKINLTITVVPSGNKKNWQIF